MNAAKMSDITLKFDSDVNSDDEDNSHILRNQTISAINVNQIANEKNVIDNY